MDREALIKKMKDLKAKSRKARAAGQKKVSESFQSGMRRLQRRIKGLTPKARKKKSESES